MEETRQKVRVSCSSYNPATYRAAIHHRVEIAGTVIAMGGVDLSRTNIDGVLRARPTIWTSHASG